MGLDGGSEEKDPLSKGVQIATLDCPLPDLISNRIDEPVVRFQSGESFENGFSFWSLLQQLSKPGKDYFIFDLGVAVLTNSSTS